jgi:hypothetical protein
MVKIHNLTSFRGEVKPVVSCHKILQHVKDLYSMEEILLGKIRGHFLPSFFLLHYWVALLVTIREF